VERAISTNPVRDSIHQSRPNEIQSITKVLRVEDQESLTQTDSPAQPSGSHGEIGHKAKLVARKRGIAEFLIAKNGNQHSNADVLRASLKRNTSSPSGASQQAPLAPPARHGSVSAASLFHIASG
jgi:hypothetical protein